MSNTASEKRTSFRTAFESDSDLSQYGSNALSVFTLALYLRLDDVDDFAANAITEGPNDKKVDICYLDLNESRAIIAQSYLSSNWSRKSAPANKASDLSTAMTWLLSVSEDQIPVHLQPKAIDLRRAIVNGDVKRIDIFYIHNCPESTNVENELKAVVQGSRDILRAMLGGRQTPTIAHRELGIHAIEDLYRSRDSEILVDDWLKIPKAVFIREEGTEWQAVLTTVSGLWIQDLHKKHGDRLFSANYRDYLGSTNRRGNINFQITQTAEVEPTNFWVYNNGITALTHEIQVHRNRIAVRGISIINGAQTSGALSEARIDATKKTKVMIRLVECPSRDLIDKVILYNNTQNEIKPADRRSNDSVQKNLRDEFAKYGVVYVHRRRTGRTPKNAITAAAIAAALCAFHGEPQVALRNAKDIFNEDTVYERVFPKNISAKHIFLVRSLSLAIDMIKTELNAKKGNGTATQMDERQYEVLKYSASKPFLFYLVGALAEEIMKNRVSDLFEWKCRRKVVSPENISMRDAWSSALRALLPQIAVIMEQEGEDAFYDVPRSSEQTQQVAQKSRALIASLQSVLGQQFEPIRKLSTI